MSLKYKNCFDQNKELKDKLYMTNVILDSQKEKNKDNEILLSHKNEMLDMLKQQKQTKSTINPNIKLILHSIESQIKSPIYFKIHNELIEECKIYLSNIKCKLIESIKVGSQEESEKILASQIYHIIKLKTVITFLFQQKDESTKEKILFNFSKLIRVYNSIMKMYSNSLNNEREIMFNFDVEDIAKAVGELEAMFIIIPEEKVENDSLQNEMLLTVDAIEDMSKQAELNMDKCLDSDVKVTIQYKDTLLIGSKDLLSAIKILVEKSIILQISINKTHKNISNMQFYKKHNRWKNGLISAVKAVAWSVGLFMNTAEKVIVGDETVERLIVTSHEIASSSAQLVVAGVSRANPDDQAKSDLAIASKNVKIIVSKIVNECREYIKKNEISKDEKIDICNLSKNEVKFFEMERKTAILTFERKIIEHNQFISKLRKTHYHDEEEEYE
ncbi:hypothetical protein A3Q56_05638 [Intoshia linei]|uniref:I/LWEQ domain-containing protein n=1 Tax=Intoshia linei TaxID=1819745 RepID=A0A177AXB4_9BILA|nr:hypothetical protein A3Q56_05638 [Intoshia linei]